MSDEVELRCDTMNDTNTYYVIDYNLGIEHEIHGAVQFKTVDKDGNVTYKSNITTINTFLKELAVYQKQQWEKVFKDMGESIAKGIKNDTLYMPLDGKLVKYSEWKAAQNEGQ